jgi:hypothetical protein
VTALGAKMSHVEFGGSCCDRQVPSRLQARGSCLESWCLAIAEICAQANAAKRQMHNQHVYGFPMAGTMPPA